MSGTLAPVLFTQVFAASVGGALIGAPFLRAGLTGREPMLPPLVTRYGIAR
ncbi:MAG TPA: hypothetical protein VGR85_09545 [Candidatus Limnocylindria bacterium]|jgi:hypothetical protein|nr:hypothetical protein [Candidatus Limnocylindria bacterium]